MKDKIKQVMTLGELMDKVHRLFPNATVDSDFDGQIIVYTNLKEIVETDVPYERWSIVELEPI